HRPRRADVWRGQRVRVRRAPRHVHARDRSAGGRRRDLKETIMTNEALRTILPIAGWPESRAGEVEITGAYDPILPTSFRITETGTATLAAVGLAVADLWELRTGRRQKISLDTRQATASLRSGKYLVMNDEPVDSSRNTIMGTYPTKDGRWSYLHC